MHWIKPTFRTNQILTGHGNFKDNLFKLGLTDNSQCATCGVTDTIQHYLFDCNLYNEQRDPLNTILTKYGLHNTPPDGRLRAILEASPTICMANDDTGINDTKVSEPYLELIRYVNRTNKCVTQTRDRFIHTSGGGADNTPHNHQKGRNKLRRKRKNRTATPNNTINHNTVKGTQQPTPQNTSRSTSYDRDRHIIARITHNFHQPSGEGRQTPSHITGQSSRKQQNEEIHTTASMAQNVPASITKIL